MGTGARMLHDKSFTPPAGVEAGYLSAMLCFAAERSVEEKRHVDVSRLFWNDQIVAA
jgi:hypothetical protein